MQRRSATRRASSMSWPAQQAPFLPIAAPWSYSWSVMPITSQPASTSSAAAHELSTPPDMATTTRHSAAGRSSCRSWITGLFDVSFLDLDHAAQHGASWRCGQPIGRQFDCGLVCFRGPVMALLRVLMENRPGAARALSPSATIRTSRVCCWHSGTARSIAP